MPGDPADISRGKNATTIGEVGGLPDAAEGRADQTKANLKQAAEKVKDALRTPAADPRLMS